MGRAISLRGRRGAHASCPSHALCANAIVSGGRDAEIRVWVGASAAGIRALLSVWDDVGDDQDLDTGKCVSVLGGHTGSIVALRCSR